MRPRDAHKVTGMIDLIRFFEAGGSTNTDIIAQKYGIGRRSAQRWLFDIERWVPLEANGPNYRKARFE